MLQENPIPADEFCVSHNINITFLETLNDYGLISISKTQDTYYVDAGDLSSIEKMIRLHFELDINMEGIDAIIRLLQRMETLQEEMMQLKNRQHLFHIDAGSASTMDSN